MRIFFSPREGFNNARSWLADVREHADPHLTCILVGNKVDLVADSSGDGGTGTGAGPGHGRHREVTTDEAEVWAKEEGLLFVEASAKSGQNVQLAFEQASRDILDKIRRGVFEDDRV
jgi:Ras-related protein Rab-2A